MSGPGLSSQILTDLLTIRIGNHGIIAVYTLLVYEWLLMLSEEYNLIHQARWTSVKFAYLVCRYYPLLVWPICIWIWIGRHDLYVCHRMIIPVSICLLPFHLSSQGVLFIRAYAFTGRKTIILILLGTTYVAIIANDIWVFGFGWDVANVDLYNMFGPMGCFPVAKQGGLKAGMLLIASVVGDVLSVTIIVVVSIGPATLSNSLPGASLALHSLTQHTRCTRKSFPAARHVCLHCNNSDKLCGYGSVFLSTSTLWSSRPHLFVYSNQCIGLPINSPTSAKSITNGVSRSKSTLRARERRFGLYRNTIRTGSVPVGNTPTICLKSNYRLALTVAAVPLLY